MWFITINSMRTSPTYSIIFLISQEGCTLLVQSGAVGFKTQASKPIAMQELTPWVGRKEAEKAKSGLPRMSISLHLVVGTEVMSVSVTSKGTVP